MTQNGYGNMTGVEIELEERTLTVNNDTFRRVQAVWRGAVVRQQLLALRQEYEKLVRDTEPPGFSLHLTWPKQLTATPSFNKSTTPGLTVTTTPRKTALVHASLDNASQPHTQMVVLKDAVTGPNLTQSKKSSIALEKEDQPEVVVPQEISASTEGDNERTGGGENENGVGHSASVGVAERCGGSRVNSSCVKGNLASEARSSGPSQSSPEPSTAVWDTMDAFKFPSTTDIGKQFDHKTLLSEQNTIAMELLWIQQAIDSRKQYLRLRQDMAGDTT